MGKEMPENLRKERMIKQINIGNWWGALMTLAGRLNIYYSTISLVLVAFFAYPTVSGFIVNYTGISIPFWIFILIVILAPVVVMILEYKYSLASYIAFNNEQAYKHDNPIRRDLVKLQKDSTTTKKDIKEMKKILNKLSKKFIAN